MTVLVVKYNQIFMNFNFAAFTESLMYDTHQQKNPDCRPSRK